MRRSSREFRAGAFELEGRVLLSGARVTAPVHAPIPIVMPPAAFEGTFDISGHEPFQIVSQQAGSATLTLRRSNPTGTQQARVATAPSPYVGVNVGALDQTVTFADGQTETTVTIPILAGAPNPGEVDVPLVVGPVGAPIDTPPSMFSDLNRLDLKVLASDPTAPPKAVNVYLTNLSINLQQAIVVSFNKPMDPVSASNVNNYSATLVNYDHHATSYLFGLSHRTSSTVASRSLSIQSAQYDPATQSVTLIPDMSHDRHGLGGSAAESAKLASRAKPSFRRGQPSNAAQGLTDLEGNPVNAGTTPGKVELNLSRLSFSGELASPLGIGI